MGPFILFLAGIAASASDHSATKPLCYKGASFGIESNLKGVRGRRGRVRLELLARMYLNQ